MLKVKQKVLIRSMLKQDLPQILAIEKQLSVYSWNEQDFLTALRQRNCFGSVAESGDKILGNLIFVTHPTEYELVKLTIHPSHYRRQVASQFIDKLKGRLGNLNRNKITGVVEESNLTAQLFFKNQGFQAVEVFRHYFEGGATRQPEDGYHFVYEN